ncbi:hypothetical protein [Cypionkella sp.]|uniref:hypothetical protein n=1 Tax=Cypionkella sp. TaxID=2811411 RepID=UPI0037514F6D
MIDPVSAFALATGAFNMIKKAVEAGREIEDCVGYFGKFFQGVSDISKAEEESKNPPLFKKLLSRGSVEEEAFQAVVHRQKVQQMENELRELITYRYGNEVYRDMLIMRRQIRQEREQTVYKQQQRRKAFLWNSLYISLISICVGILWWMVLLFIDLKGG